MTAPAVSVVIPTRNRLDMLKLALLSVLEQRAVAVEIIVVDEASTDQTSASFEGLAVDNLKYLRHSTPRGPSAARNAGAALARGKWLAFLDDDDVWHPDKLRIQLARLTASNLAWSPCSAVLIEANLTPFATAPTDEQLSTSLLRYNSVPGGGSGVVVDRGIFERAGGFTPDILAEDWELWLRLNQLSAPATVADYLVAYRVSRNSASHNARRMELAHEEVANRHPVVAANAPTTSAQHDRYLALQAIRADDRHAAAHYLWRSRRDGKGHRALAAWALAVGRTWERPVALRSAPERAVFRRTTEWLGPLSARASRFSLSDL